jgi:SNF2 family DNA or RNA helicase
MKRIPVKRVYSGIQEGLSRLERAQYDPPSWQKVCIQAHLLSLGSEITELRAIQQLEGERIQVLPHQIAAVMTAINKMHTRAILADEVGLGKTIEAGLILKEYLSRGLARRILILTPAPLTTQWQGELSGKFGEHFSVANEETQGWQNLDRLIVSLDTAKHPINSEALLRKRWDILVVDEAHRLKNDATVAYQFVKKLQSRYMLLLTATPIQNSLFELYNLVNLVSEGLLGTKDSFRSRFIEDPKGRVLKNPEDLSKKLAQVMVRHRRSEVGIRFVDRKVETIRLEGTPEELRLHDAVVQFVGNQMGKGVSKGQQTLQFIRLSRMLSSSPAALAKSVSAMMGYVTVEETQELAPIADLARRIQVVSKLEALKTFLVNHQDKALVFTGFYETQDFLADALTREGYKVLCFNGKMGQKEKDRVVAEFKRDGQVLLLTDAGSEGVNLQFAHALINYDLPWNPMRVEQRIGRVHRIGQTRDVLIVNLSIKGTIEDYVLQILEQKIELFTQAVGETDLILSNLKGADSFEKVIVDLIAKAKERGKLEESFATFGANLEMAKRAADQIREFDEQTLSRLDLSAIKH